MGIAVYVHLGHTGNIIAALLIATFKSLLVAAYFMHLSSEKSMIFKVLVFTIFFFFGLMLLTLFSYYGELGVKL